MTPPPSGPANAAGTQRSGREAGFATSLAAIILAALALYIVFKRKDWL
jgi:Mg2+ and Co2+ transporter CorA